jgi:hypothetical protein
MTTIAFRLGADEHDLLAPAGNGQLSNELRSLLVTHLLIGRKQITDVTFHGGYRAERSGVGSTWRVVDKGGSILLSDVGRDEAIVRCEWIAQVAAGAIPTACASRSVTFRLSDGERVALARLAAANRTTVSAALRSFVVTALARRKQRLVEVSFGHGYRAYSGRNGWSVGAGDNAIARNLSREDAFQRADWLAQASSASAA